MVQEITTTSWGKRIINAFFGVLIGIALIIGGIYLVFWNEAHGLHTAQSLQQAQNILISIPTTPVDPKNNMHVVYLSGLATTDETLNDPLFNVAEKAIQLNRQVQMYQWKEDVSTKTEKNLGGSEQEIKTYSYRQIWSSEPIDSSRFKEQAGHENPSIMPIQSKIQYANKVTVGDFFLPSQLITQISGDNSVDLSKADMVLLQAKFNKPAHADGESIYIGDNSTSPKIGDLRITMTVVPPQKTVSIIAQQSGSTLQPFMANAGQAVILIEMGQVSPEQMIHHAQVQNEEMTWLLRLVTLVMLIFGFGLILNPIVILSDVVPFFGSLVSIGTLFIAFVCGLSLWTISIAIAWFAFRPVFAIGIILVTAVICYLLYLHKKNLHPKNN